jgi:hypothetical protein
LENVKIFLLRIEMGAGEEEGTVAKSRGRSEGLELGQEHRAEKGMGQKQGQEKRQLLVQE